MMRTFFFQLVGGAAFTTIFYFFCDDRFVGSYSYVQTSFVLAGIGAVVGGQLAAQFRPTAALPNMRRTVR